MRFTPPIQIVYALNQALDEFFEETSAGRFNRYRKSWETLVNGFQQLGFKLLLPLKYQAGLITTIIEPTDKNYSFQQMHDYLYGKGYTIYPGKIGDLDSFRVANIGAISQEDIQVFLTHLGDYIKNNRIQLP